MNHFRKISRSRNFMSTGITISVVVDNKTDSIDVFDAIELAFGEFDRIVKLYTRFNETSELALLNQANQQSSTWHHITAEFEELIRIMLGLAKKTNGAFDPTVIDFLEAYGYDRHYDFKKLEQEDLTQRIIEMAKTRPSWQEIQITKGKAKLAKGQRLDLGGIGKGYAMDCATAHLDKFSNYLIEAGGDIICKGHNPEQKDWEIGLKHKHNETELIVGKFKYSGEARLALGCSGSWARKVKNFHHLINPASGEPASSTSTVFVTAESATQADGLATALFVAGDQGLSFLPDSSEALIIKENGNVITHPIDLSRFNYLRLAKKEANS